MVYQWTRIDCSNLWVAGREVHDLGDVVNGTCDADVFVMLMLFVTLMLFLRLMRFEMLMLSVMSMLSVMLMMSGDTGCDVDDIRTVDVSCTPDFVDAVKLLICFVVLAMVISVGLPMFTQDTTP